MEPQIQPPPLETGPSVTSRILRFGKKLIFVLVLIAVGFVVGVFSDSLRKSQQAAPQVAADPQPQPQVEGAGTVPENGWRSSAAVYKDGVALYFLEKGSLCGDHPRYACNGALYEIANGQMKQVAPNVIGAELLYYEPGARALLQSRWGDGGCRETKFYVYSFATASSTMTFDKNNCDEATYEAYIRSVDDYLSQFGL